MTRTFLLTVLAVACAARTTYEPREWLRGYEILISGRDSLSLELAAELGRRGFRVRREVKGGGPPTAALVAFTFRAPEPESAPWLHIRLADTRSGVLVASVSVPLDSIAPSAKARAQAVVAGLLTQVRGESVLPP